MHPRPIRTTKPGQTIRTLQRGDSSRRAPGCYLSQVPQNRFRRASMPNQQRPIIFKWQAVAAAKTAKHIPTLLRGALPTTHCCLSTQTSALPRLTNSPRDRLLPASQRVPQRDSSLPPLQKSRFRLRWMKSATPWQGSRLRDPSGWLAGTLAIREKGVICVSASHCTSIQNERRHEFEPVEFSTLLCTTLSHWPGMGDSTHRKR